MSKGEPIISVKDLKVQRGGAVVLEGVNLDIHEGDFVGLSGPNGSGKSTLLMTIIGELEPTAGSVKVYGAPPGSKASQGRLAWVSQAAAQLPTNLRISVRELVALGALKPTDVDPLGRSLVLEMIDTVFLGALSFFITGALNLVGIGRQEQRERVEKAIQLVGLEDVAERDVNRLSGGQKQRAVVARGLATEADVLILDEPLAGVDRASRDDFLRLLDRLCREEGKTLLMVTHDQTAIHQCTHCAICIDGNVQFDDDHTSAPAVLQVESLSIEATYPTSSWDKDAKEGA
jgi:zinc transport system ATP-binding protein